MTAQNGRITDRLAAIINTIEILLDDLDRISTPAYEDTMNNAKVNAVKDKRDGVSQRVAELHNLMVEAALTSSDNDVVTRSGGGGGK